MKIVIGSKYLIDSIPISYVVGEEGIVARGVTFGIDRIWAQSNFKRAFEDVYSVSFQVQDLVAAITKAVNWHNDVTYFEAKAIILAVLVKFHDVTPQHMFYITDVVQQMLDDPECKRYQNELKMLLKAILELHAEFMRMQKFIKKAKLDGFVAEDIADNDYCFFLEVERYEISHIYFLYLAYSKNWISYFLQKYLRNPIKKMMFLINAFCGKQLEIKFN